MDLNLHSKFLSTKLFLIFLFFCTIQVYGAVTSESQNNLLITNLFSPNQSDGEVILYLSPPSLYVPDGTFIGLSNSEETTGAKLQTCLALYTSMTIVADDSCVNFTPRPNVCSEMDCQNTTETPQTVTYPYFQATGKVANAMPEWNSNIDPSMQALTWIQLIAATNCNQTTGSYGFQLNGLIGMGTSRTDFNSSFVPAYFSIYLSFDILNNRLLFYFDPNRAQSTTPLAVLSSDGDWHVSQLTSISVGTNETSLNNTNLIFDINMQPVYLPLPVYTFVMNQISDTAQINCNHFLKPQGTVFDYTVLPMPVCECPNDTLSLPTITISVGNQDIVLPPQMYAQTGDCLEETNMNFYFITMGASKSSQFYVTEDYQNYIILGSQFMKYYYTLFDGTNSTNTISLYLANQNTIFPKIVPGSSSS